MTMNKIKKQINNELSKVSLSENTINNIKNWKENEKISISKITTLILLTCIVSFSAVYAVNKIFSTSVNGEEMPALDNMSIIKVKDVENYDKDDYGVIRKKYDNIGQLESELGVRFLSSIYSENNPYKLIKYKKIGEGYNLIEIGAYIVGDLTNIEYQEEYDYYSFTAGENYQTPVDLKIEIISDESQQPFDTEYLGVYEYLETITQKDGYKVNLLESKALGKNEICAIFVADGIRYTLSGHVEIDEMIDIVNSMD